MKQDRITTSRESNANMQETIWKKPQTVAGGIHRVW